MGFMLDAIIVTDNNKEAFTKVIESTAQDTAPFNLVMYGPVGSGKSAVMAARAKDFDLLSTKKAGYYHAEEIDVALTNGFPDEFFERLGTVDILLLDELSRFMKDETDLALCLKLLVNERKRQGLTTIIASDVDPQTLDLSSLEGALDDFEMIEVKPLDKEGKKRFARASEAEFRQGNDTLPQLSDDAVDYLVTRFEDKLSDMRYAIQFLVRFAEQEPGCIITSTMCEQLLV